MINQKFAIVFSAVVLFMITIFSTSLSVSSVFAQEQSETGTTGGNITGGGINVPLNETNPNTTAESNVTASNTINTITNQQTSAS